MKIVFNEPTETATHNYEPGVAYDVDDDRAAELIAEHGAVEAPETGDESGPRTATRQRPKKATKK